MNPITHLLVSWTVAESALLGRRDRALVTLAGVAPDLDGIGLAAELLTRGWEEPLLWYSRFHHVLAHNLGAALLAGLAGLALGCRKGLTAALCVLTFHLHLLGDLAGSRGPDGSQWPIPYLLPFSDRAQWTWSGQWELNAWPNVLLSLVLLAMAFRLAWTRGRSPLELVSTRADRAFVAALRQRFQRA